MMAQHAQQDTHVQFSRQIVPLVVQQVNVTEQGA
jgi:hypothetical protein